MEDDNQLAIKQEERKKAFKKGVDSEDSRRKREDATIEIRKSKRDDQLMKRRKDVFITPAAPGFGAPVQPQTVPVAGVARLDPALQMKLQSLGQWTHMVNSDDHNMQYEGTKEFRKLLSVERNPPIQQVIDCGVVPRLISFLYCNDRPNLQFEAAWAVTNIASGSSEQTRLVLDNQAVPVLVQLLQSTSEDVREQAVWALGNIAGDSPLCRDFVLSAGALHPILNILMESKRITMVRNATWTLSNFCRGKPPAPFEVVRVALPILQRLVTSTDEEVLTDACWALSYLSDGPNERIQAVIDTHGVVPRMVQLLVHPNIAVQTPALRTVGNIVTGDDMQTQYVIHSGALPYLLSLLSSPKRSIRKEACWTISNITAGNKHQIQAVIQQGIIPPLIQILATADFDVKKEAAWAISNATSGGTPEQIVVLANEGAIKPLCDLLTVHDPKILIVAMEGLENILRVGATMDGNPYALKVEEYGGLDKLEDLQDNAHEGVYKKALELVDNYLSGTGDVAGMMQAPAAMTQQAQPSAFQFGVQPQPTTFQFGVQPQQPFFGSGSMQ